MTLQIDIKKFVSKVGRMCSFKNVAFVQGHSHITLDQAERMKSILYSRDKNKEVICEYTRQMENVIGGGSSGYAIAYAAGRMAFYDVLRALNVSHGDEVILLGFTCSVMPSAVLRVGAVPIFTDVDVNTFGSGPETIESGITPRTKVIVAQHSFGIPCKIKEIVELGRKKNIFVVEDCAITFDSSVDNIKVGNFGDAAIFSTDHTKPLNTMIGGLLYTTNKVFYEKVKGLSRSMPDLNHEHQKRLYERFLFERAYYVPERTIRVVISNIVQTLFRKTKKDFQKSVFLTDDYCFPAVGESNYPYPAAMPSFLAKLGLFELERWNTVKKRRKAILTSYLDAVGASCVKQYLCLPKAYYDKHLDIVPLRFVFTSPEHELLNKRMSKFIDINWTWFREPVISCSRGVENLKYSYGECKISEEVGSKIINWPCVFTEYDEYEMTQLFKNVIGQYAGHD